MSNELVRQGYNIIATKYTGYRNQFKSIKYLEKLNNLLKPDSTILDIGCGSGEPIDKFFIDRGHRVIGIDSSEKQIELARKNVPQARYIIKDMSELVEGEYQVDAVVSFYAIFHIPRENHQELFQMISSFLPEEGWILVSMGSSEGEGTEDDFLGVKMYWSRYGAEKNRNIIESAGFKVILDEIDTSAGERHQIILAHKGIK